MQEVRPFIQLFRYDPSEQDHEHFEKIIINTNKIVMVDWIEDSDFVAFVCNTDHPEGVETIIEDYGSPKIAERRYYSVLTILGANDGTAMSREKAMRKAVAENMEIDEFLRNAFKKVAAGKWMQSKDECENEQVEETEDEHE